MTISEGNNGGDDGVRERSPLHEVGERAWPCGGAGEDFSAAADSPDGGGSRAKFRLRVGRRGGPNGGSASQRGPLVRLRIFFHVYEVGDRGEKSRLYMIRTENSWEIGPEQSVTLMQRPNFSIFTEPMKEFQ